jgi:RNA polymerase sigma-70 factor (ECF subfamily)
MEINKLAVRAKNGDLEAFEQLYRHFAQRLFNYVRVKIQNRQDAEDVLQNIFIKSYKGLSTLRPGNLNFTAWLFKIAKNTINDYLRKQYKQPKIVSIDDVFEVSGGQSVYQEIAAKSDLETARETFKYLPQRHRSMLELRFFRQLSVSETAKALNTTSMAVRIMQYRVRKKLKYVLPEASY